MKVDKSVFRIICKRIYRKITPCKVKRKISGKFHLFGATAVPIISVDAESGNFDLEISDKHGDCSVGKSCFDNPEPFGKQLRALQRSCVCRHVVILRNFSEESVPYGSSDYVSVKAGIFQNIYRKQYMLRQFHFKFCICIAFHTALHITFHLPPVLSRRRELFWQPFSLTECRLLP